MAWSEKSEEEYFEKQPIYDLRQIYAKDLLGDTLKKIKVAREERKYSLWFGLIRWDLFADLYQKFDETELELVENKIKEVKTVINKYQQAFLNKSTNPEDNEKVIQAIWDLEVLMKNLSEEHSIYGKKEWEDEGL